MKNILNLQGVVVLDAKQQKNIFGGLLPGSGIGDSGENLGYCNARKWVKDGNGGYRSVVMHMGSYSNAVTYAASGDGGQGDVCCTVSGCANSPWASLG